MPNKNQRETGGRELRPKSEPDANEEFSQEAAENRKPPGGVGNTESLSDHNEKTRHFGSQQPGRRRR